MFKESLNTAVFTTRFVIDDNSPILFVFHYDDGSWQFSGAEENLSDSDFRIVSLGEILKHDDSIKELASMPINSEAIRLTRKSAWRITVKN
jgi:hypothetical protein